MSRSGVRDDAAGGEMSHAGSRVGRREHHNRRAILGAVFADQGNFSRTGGNQPLLGAANGLSSLGVMNVLR